MEGYTYHSSLHIIDYKPNVGTPCLFSLIVSCWRTGLRGRNSDGLVCLKFPRTGKTLRFWRRDERGIIVSRERQAEGGGGGWGLSAACSSQTNDGFYRIGGRRKDPHSLLQGCRPCVYERERQREKRLRQMESANRETGHIRTRK